jgi:hypothetical protein
VVPLSGVSATTSTLLFDDVNLVTSFAVVNLGTAPATVTIVARDNQGNTIGTSSIALGAGQKTANQLRDVPGLSGVAGKRGSADFTIDSGNLAVLGLRFGTDGAAFTSIPTADR